MQSTMHYQQGSRPSNNAGSYGHGSPYRQNQYQAQPQLYTQTPPPSTDNLGYGHNAMANLTQAFGVTNLGSGMSLGKQGNGSFGANAVNANMLAMHPSGQFYYYLPDGSVVMSGMNTVPTNYQQYSGAYNTGIPQGSQLTQLAYNGYTSSMGQAMANSSRLSGWAAPEQLPAEVPDLAAPQRDSQSSNEGSPGPHTPFNFGAFPSAAFAYGVDNGPSPWMEPTPVQLLRNFPFQQYWRTMQGEYIIVDYYNITRAEPTIPVAVPAKQTKDSGRGTFDKILDNESGTTNVYIRGLHPDTTDEILEGYGLRFGDIARCKAIIDLTTGGCKGFGFIEYHNYVDAENCIRCFYYLGYEAKFAKLSHNERLKACEDPENNNLYVSNLPKVMTENDLKNLFTGVFPMFNVTSTKVLKDAQGISRGVGFVRFETHDICDQVLEHHNNQPVCNIDDNSPVQLRYADSQAQKKLKEESAAHRSFKAHEYNMEAFGPASPFYRSPITPVDPSPLPSMASRSSGSWRCQTSVSPGTFMASQPTLGASYVQKSQLQSVWSSMDKPSVSMNTGSPCASAATKRATNETISISGTTPIDSNGSEFSSKDTVAVTIKEEGSEGEHEIVTAKNKVSASKDDNADGLAKIDPSPSKVGKAKL